MIFYGSLFNFLVAYDSKKRYNPQSSWFSNIWSPAFLLWDSLYSLCSSDIFFLLYSDFSHLTACPVDLFLWECFAYFHIVPFICHSDLSSNTTSQKTASWYSLRSSHLLSLACFSVSWSCRTPAVTEHIFVSLFTVSSPHSRLQIPWQMDFTVSVNCYIIWVRIALGTP